MMSIDDLHGRYGELVLRYFGVRNDIYSFDCSVCGENSMNDKFYDLSAQQSVQVFSLIFNDHVDIVCLR